jgi:uncharacterized membrane protein (UPF0127 family)
LDEQYGFKEMNRVVVFLVFLVACSQVPQISNEPFVEFNDSKFFVKLADEPSEWQSGLMFVENMPKNEGMLFIFNDSSPRTFWMKNTLIPLDMIFIDENFAVVDVKENVPPCESDPCQTYPSEVPSKFVLELNAGSVKENNIFVGSIMRMSR